MAHQRQVSLSHQRSMSKDLRQRHASDAASRAEEYNAYRASAEHRHLRSDGTIITADDDGTYYNGLRPQRSPGLGDGRPIMHRRTPSSKNIRPTEVQVDAPILELPPGASTPNLERATQGDPIVQLATPPEPPGWANMPNKPQLAILAASRFVDFFQMAALQTYMVHQLRSFDPSLPDATISQQAGVLQGAFTAAQIVTSILWGRAADRPTVGRKMVLMIGLVGTALGCIGVGFSRTYQQAVFWRLLCGAINGTVGSARTMVAEVTPKPWHPRAFLLLPAAFNVANVAGPILSGLVSEPFDNLPNLFGPGGTFGGVEGVMWMKRYPYAIANLMSTVLLLGEAVLVHYFLDETLRGKRPFDVASLNPMTLLSNASSTLQSAKSQGYRKLAHHDTSSDGLLSQPLDHELDQLSTHPEKTSYYAPNPPRLPFSRIWTPNVLWTLLSIAIFDFHMGAFANLWILFLATPREFIPENDSDIDIEPRSAFKFASGLAFPPPTIGFAMAIIGFIGVALQFLLYPWANSRFGLMRCFRYSLILFPMAYALAPYIALIPSTSPSPLPASGTLVWLGISSVLLLQVSARTFALPATIILLNNSSPHPSVLATIHGLGQACSATFRTLGPILAGWWYGVWMERGVVGMAWWIVGFVAALGVGASWGVRNGSGHEILLAGEEKEGEGGSGDGR